MDVSIKTIHFSNLQNNTNKYIPVFTSSCSSEFIPSNNLIKYKKAQKYTQSVIKKHKIVDLDRCNLNKLDGIQHGINVFDGLNITQIRLLYKYLGSISVYRGCSNGCVHCFAEAKPNIQNSNNINSMSWEDLENLTKGFAELNKRLGFGKNTPNPLEKPVIIPFVDADSMEIVLKDKNNIEHDMIDIAKVFTSNMNRRVLFDSSGWNPKSSKMQKRAEKYVEYMKNNNDFVSIHISLNPFHKLHAKYVEYINSNPVLAQKFRNLYTDRMANVFYTFTPVMKKPEFRVLNRAVNNNAECNENFKENAHRILISEIRAKLETMYKSQGMPNSEIEKNLSLFDRKTEFINTKKLTAIGRMENLFPPNSPEHNIPNKHHMMNLQHPQNIINNPNSQFIIDCNGKVYLTDFFNVIGTDISLNLGNKDKESVPFFSYIEKHLTTKEMTEATQTGFIKLLKRIFHRL